MPKKMFALAGAALAISVALFAVASPACASNSEHRAYTDESNSVGSSRQGGYLYFRENYDRVEVIDNDADGYRVELDVYAAGHYRYSLEASGLFHQDGADCYDHNLPENTSVTFEMYLYDGDTGRTAGLIYRTWYNDH